MREQLKQRLVGAIVLVALGVVVIPEFLEPPEEPTSPLESRTQSAPSEFVSEVVVVEEQRPPDEQDDSSRVPEPVAPPSAAAPLADSQDTRETGTPTEPRSVSVVDPEPPAPSAQLAAAASTQQAVVFKSNWVVQLATFSKSHNASDLQSKLHDMGYPVFLESHPAEKGTLTQVFVGPLRAKDEAQAALQRLEKQFKLKGIVLQR